MCARLIVRTPSCFCRCSLPEFFHFGPVNFWTEMMLGVIAVVEEKPVIDLSVAAHAPCNRLVGIGAVMPVVAIQITETMPEVPKREEIDDEPPVYEVNRIRWYDDSHDEKRHGECR